MTQTAKPGAQVPAAYPRCRVPHVEVFAEGVFRGRPYSEAEIDEFIANFEKFGPNGLKLLTPPIVLGHEENQAFLDRTDLPAAGVVERLYKGTVTGVDGKPHVTMFADFADVPVPVASLMNAKAYRKCSIEHYDKERPFDAGNGQVFTDLILRRIALLGGEVPQVKQLKDLPVAVFDYADKRVNVWNTPNGGKCFAFSEKTAMKLDAKSFQGTRWAKTFADGAIDRAMLVEKLKPLFPGITDDFAGFDDNQLTILALGVASAPTAAPVPAEMADFDRAKAIADLVVAGEDPAALEAKTDDELKAMHSTLTGIQYKDKPVPTPTSKPPVPSPAVAAAFAEQQAALVKLKAATAESEAEARRARERAKQARKEDVAAFCDRLVREGRMIPADREIFEPQLLDANDVDRSHKFIEGDKTIDLTAYEKLRRQLAARQVVVKFGEKIGKGAKEEEDAEIAKIEEHYECFADSFRKYGQTKEKIVSAFKAARNLKPGLTAEQHLTK